MMEVVSTRFGTIRVEPPDVIRFPRGLPGLEECRDWVFLAGGESDAVVWLQSLDRAEVALAAISPRRFLPEYHLRVGRSEVAGLRLDAGDAVGVLTVLASEGESVSANLRAPLVVNLAKSLGCQVISEEEAPLRYMLQPASNAWKKSA